MNAVEELGEVVKIEDKGERVLAFAGWVARWIEQGFVENDVDLADVELVGPRRRYEADREALTALLGTMLERKEWTEVVELEDLGKQVVRAADGRAGLAYRSRMKLTVLLAKPHQPEAPTAGRQLS